LAERIGAPYQTVTAEVRRLAAAELVTTTAVGRSKLIRANAANPYARPLGDIVMMAFGPPFVVGEEFAGVVGIDGLWLYGSWAARHAGAAGGPPQDIDVLVVGRPDRDAVHDAARRAERRLGSDVNITIRSPEAWSAGDDAFTTTLKSSTLLAIPGPWPSSLQ
jgi:hypothetical protein